MTAQQAGTLGARLLAIFIAVEAVKDVPIIFQAFAFPSSASMGWGMAVQFVLLSVIAAGLWFGADRIGRGLPGEQGQSGGHFAPASVQALQAAAVATLDAPPGGLRDPGHR